MRRRRAAAKLALALAAVLMLAGCSDQRIIEKVGFTRTLGLDIAKEQDGKQDDSREEGEKANKIQVTISIPKTNEQEAIVYSTEAKTTRQAMQVFDRQNDRRIVFGQLRQVVFGENLARRGTWKYLDPLFRDGTVGNRVHILVTEGDMSHLVSRVFRQAGAAGEYIDNLLRTESHTSDIPASNLYTFLRDYMDNGIEPSAAILKETSSGLIVNGIALFRGDRYVAKVEPAEKMYFGMMLGNVKSGDVFLDYPDEDYVSEDSALLNFNSKRKIKVVSIGSPSKGQPPKVIIRIRLAGTLLEYNGDLKMAQLADRTRLEGEIERFVRTKCEAVLNLMKEHQSDAIGVGQYIRNAMPYTAWKKLDWPEEFARTQITVQVSVHIKNFGKIQ